MKYKKAALTNLIFLPIFHVILALVVVMSSLLWSISSSVNDMSFEKGFLATDIALSVDLMIFLPGNLDILYSPYKPGFNNIFDFDFLKSNVEVFNVVNDPKKGIYYYSIPENIKFHEKKLSFNDSDVTIRLSKIGNDFFVSDIDKEMIDFNINRISCPDIKLDLPNKIIIDAGHGYNPIYNFSDAGFTVNNIRESELNRQLAFSFLNTAKNFFNTEVTRELEPSQVNPDIENAISDDERISKISSIDGFLLSFHSGNYSNKRFVKAFVALDDNFNKSFKLACEIVNQISSNLNANNVRIDGTAIVPVDFSLSRNKHLNVLTTNKIGVLLEIGSVKDSIINTENNIIISQSIIGGIKNAR